MEPVEIDVTAEDIKNGIPRDPTHCPIALAAKRILGNFVSVGADTIRTTKTFDEEKLYYLPKEAYHFRHSFDCERHVVPFKFTTLTKHDSNRWL